MNEASLGYIERETLSPIGTNFSKYTTYQGKDMGIRKISKVSKDTCENNRQKHRLVSGGNSIEYSKITHA